MKDKIRAFIALPSSPELASSLRRLQQRLIEDQADVKWDSPEKFHITLKFLGDVASDTLAELQSSLGTATSALPSFPLVYSSVGAFPDLIHPKVIWAGAVPNESLIALQRRVELACEQVGFVRESRPFHPHITLGRVKGTRNHNRLTATVKSITLEPITTHCPEILLIRSDLRPAGSVYTTLKSFPLKA